MAYYCQTCRNQLAEGSNVCPYCNPTAAQSFQGYPPDHYQRAERRYQENQSSYCQTPQQPNGWNPNAYRQRRQQPFDGNPPINNWAARQAYVPTSQQGEYGEDLMQPRTIPPAAFVVGGTTINVRFLLTIITAIQCLLIFLPWLQATTLEDRLLVAFMGGATSLAGSVVGGGITIFFALFFLLVVLVKKRLSFANKVFYLLSIIYSILSISLQVFYSNLLTDASARNVGVSLSPTFWFYLSLFLYVALIVIAVKCIATKNQGRMPSFAQHNRHY